VSGGWAAIVGWQAAWRAAWPGRFGFMLPVAAAAAGEPGARADPLPTAGSPPAGSVAAPAGPGPDAERELIRRARQGDVTAFEQLIAPCVQPAFALAVRLLGDRHLAEDVTQDAMIKAFTGIRQFRGDARFGTWVFRIVHNACTDALRHRARRPQLPQFQGAGEPTDGTPADPGPGPEEQAIERQSRAALLRAVAALPPEQRMVVLLRDVQGLSYEEVAAITGQNLGTIKSRLHRARAALREALGPSRA